MKGKIPLIYLILSAVMLMTCHPSKRTTQSDTEAVAKEAAIKILRNPVLLAFNGSKTHVLAFETRHSQKDHFLTKYRFVIFSCKDWSVVKQGSYQIGWIRWVSDSAVEYTPKISSTDEPTVERIDISATN